MNPTYFPQAAFLPAQTFGQKLADLFNTRAFSQEDLRSVRTSAYYSDFETVENKLRYVVSVGHALRQNDGMFIIYTTQAQITEDPIRGSIKIDAGYQKNDGDKTIICTENEVVWRLKHLAQDLEKQCDYSLAFPKNSPLRLCDDLHINLAELVANAPRKRDDIVYYQKNTALNDRCKLGA